MSLLSQIFGPFKKATREDWGMILWLCSPLWIMALFDLAQFLWSLLSS